ncbi:hypothetical protein DRO66_00580 [Candidatus Bathyarchaeota archaeon]|nr:MAG: hypothetical protein DRO66_00580 [Candidatus Bathyarchaeota archaeon]
MVQPARQTKTKKSQKETIKELKQSVADHKLKSAKYKADLAVFKKQSEDRSVAISGLTERNKALSLKLVQAQSTDSLDRALKAEENVKSLQITIKQLEKDKSVMQQVASAVKAQNADNVTAMAKGYAEGSICAEIMNRIS